MHINGQPENARLVQLERYVIFERILVAIVEYHPCLYGQLCFDWPVQI